MACFGGELVVSPSNWWEVFSAVVGAVFTKHSTAITLTPEGSTFRVTGVWNLLGGRSDGAGGPNRTTRAYAFSLSLAA